ncbi:UNVERIFIED_CONTAM: hypothetical protein FKN15_067293 [Acipenser sinensis]
MMSDPVRQRTCGNNCNVGPSPTMDQKGLMTINESAIPDTLESEPNLLLFCLPDPVASAGPTHGTLHIPVKAAKLDATALHHKTSAIALPPSEPSDSPALACGAGVNEEHYVSEATSLEDAPNYRDAGTITGMYGSVQGARQEEVLFYCTIHD